MLELLGTYRSIDEPFIAALVITVFLALSIWIYVHPAHYFPLVILAAPIPKLISIGIEQSAKGFDGFQVVTRPGFSLVELVIAAGMTVVVVQGRRIPRALRDQTGLQIAIGLCALSVLVSIGVALLRNPDEYGGSGMLYGLRFIFTTASFVVAHRLSVQQRSHEILTNTLNLLYRYGIAVIGLGIIYYVVYGAAAVSTGTDTFNLSANAIGRNSLWFFDYAYDFGFFICIVGLIALSRLVRLGRRARSSAALALILCSIAFLLIGQRGNWLMFAAMIAGYILAVRRDPVQGKDTSLFVRLTVCAFVVLLLGYVGETTLAPTQMTNKLDSLYSEDGRQSALQISDIYGLSPLSASIVNAIPIGDVALRVAQNLSGVEFFLGHPAGIGVGREVLVTQNISHYELTTVAVEQGVLGLCCFSFLLWRLWTFSKRRLPSIGLRGAEATRVCSALALTAVVTSLAALTSLFLVKFGFVMWTLLGVAASVTGSARSARVISDRGIAVVKVFQRPDRKWAVPTR